MVALVENGDFYVIINLKFVCNILGENTQNLSRLATNF